MTNHDTTTGTGAPRWTRLEYHPTEAGTVELRGEGETPFTRPAVGRTGSARTAVRVAAVLNAALREGAAYGPIDDQVELADVLLHRPDPVGRVRYDLTSAFRVERTEGGATTTLDLPQLASKTSAVQLSCELTTAFRIGSEDPHAVPQAPGETRDAGDVLAARVEALTPGQTLLEIAAAGAAHLAVESPDGILCDCGRAAADRFKFARIHMPGGRSRSRRLPAIREVASAGRAVTS